MAPQQQRVRQHLPSSPVPFTARKHKILEQLSVPDAEYTDASPKGSVDVAIRELIDELNALDGFVTTSSCAGRVSVFLEGRRAPVMPASTSTGPATPGEPHPQSATQSDDKNNGSTIATIAGPGEREAVARGCLVGEKDAAGHGVAGESGSAQPGRRRKRLIHFKFEPMILHVLTASLEHAQLLLKCAFAAGFRESGALNLLPAITATELQVDSSSPVTPMVGVRTMGLALESLIGYIDDNDGAPHCTVSVDYLRDLLQIANERFAENAARIARFRAALQEALAGPPPKLGEGARSGRTLLPGESAKKPRAYVARKRCWLLDRRRKRRLTLRLRTGRFQQRARLSCLNMNSMGCDVTNSFAIYTLLS
ncbi:tRNA wybutosine-synthesizing protein [Colletotrichum tofieldiae]|nr:tRNA wybutosine-synthesizing protein [Colletotrichum tofieldiae]